VTAPILRAAPTLRQWEVGIDFAQSVNGKVITSFAIGPGTRDEKGFEFLSSVVDGNSRCCLWWQCGGSDFSRYVPLYIDIQLGRLTPMPEFPRSGSLRSKFHRLSAFASLRAMGFLIQATVHAKAPRRKGR
jgi:hypothetical protein